MNHSDLMATYRRLTGIPLAYDPLLHDSQVYLFLKRFDADDLALVVKHIKKRYKDKPEYVSQMMRFTYLIRQLDTFAEHLADAKAMNPHRHTERDKVLMASGREPERKPVQEPKQPKEILRRLSKEQLSEGWKGILKELDNPEP